MPYRALFPAGVDYRGADLPGNQAATLVLENGRIPLLDASADFVLSTQVLEHAADPASYLAEARRVLKPGGQLLLSTHGTFMFHPDPEDFWRWTHAGLKKVVQDAGFAMQSRRGIVGAVPTAIQYFVDHLELHVGPQWLKRALFWFSDVLIRATDAAYSEQGRKIGAMVYVVRARKP
jgi:SAM-dependent methyltransferase